MHELMRMFGITSHESHLGRFHVNRTAEADADADALSLPSSLVDEGRAEPVDTVVAACGYSSLLQRFDVDQHASLMNHQLARSSFRPKRVNKQSHKRSPAQRRFARNRRPVFTRLTHASSGLPVFIR